MIGKGDNGIFQFTCDDDSAFYVPAEGGDNQGEDDNVTAGEEEDDNVTAGEED
jgi:hypothetical protein